MTDRILDLSADPARLSVSNGLLLIERQGQPDVTVPFEEIAVLVGAHRQLVFTQAVFARLAEAGGVFVACDGKSQPAALMLPLEGHHAQGGRIRDQMNASRPLEKQLWRQIVSAKIAMQGSLLAARGIEGAQAFPFMAARVTSGDKENLEAQAAITAAA